MKTNKEKNSVLSTKERNARRHYLELRKTCLKDWLLFFHRSFFTRRAAAASNESEQLLFAASLHLPPLCIPQLASGAHGVTDL
jgi:hypothetical protein